MQVVNLGLHGDLGNAYHEQIAKLNINEGDIVVVSGYPIAYGEYSEYAERDLLIFRESLRKSWIVMSYQIIQITFSHIDIFMTQLFN